MLKVVFILLKPVQGSFPHANMLNGKQEWSDGVMSERRPKHLGLSPACGCDPCLQAGSSSQVMGSGFQGSITGKRCGRQQKAEGENTLVTSVPGDFSPPLMAQDHGSWQSEDASKSRRGHFGSLLCVSGFLLLRVTPFRN